MGETPPFDLLRLPLLGPVLRWRFTRPVVQTLTLLVAVGMILHGLLGPTLAPKNLATTLGWVHYRGLLALTLLLAGNFFCYSCPFLLVRDLGRRFFRPRLNWPLLLRKKWLGLCLLVAVLFLYELFDLWASPSGTACLILGYFLAILAVDSLFKHASFCKWVCPIGQFNFVSSALSPLEVRVRDRSVCQTCRTRDCIRGRQPVAAEKGQRLRSLPMLPVLPTSRGCELALYQPRKVGNMDCTFCLDCVHACPHDNIGVIGRLPAEELLSDPLRSGIGRFSRRPDLAALVLIFTFAGLLNAFAMVRPVYTLQRWLADLLSLRQEAPVLVLLFLLGLVVLPALLMGAATLLTPDEPEKSDRLAVAVRFSYALAPLGFGIWTAHYCFHFLTGLWTFIPVIQSAALDIGLTLLGEPRWDLGGLPVRVVHPMEVGLLSLGMVGSLLVAHRTAEAVWPHSPRRAFLPWAGLILLLYLAAVWLLLQPMEMRGTFLGG